MISANLYNRVSKCCCTGIRLKVDSFGGQINVRSDPQLLVCTGPDTDDPPCVETEDVYGVTLSCKCTGPDTDDPPCVETEYVYGVPLSCKCTGPDADDSPV